MVIHSTTVTSWIIQIPTGDPGMPLIQLGSIFKTKEDAQKNLLGWRAELQEVAQVNQHIWEDWTAHQS